MSVNFVGPATPLTINDYQHLAMRMGCEVAVIRAVSSVESSGKGFLPDKRPQVLYESHAFHTETRGAFDKSHPDLSTPTWVRNYGAAGAHQYDRIQAAMKLNEAAALESTSWGLFQILGMHWKELGYKSVVDYVTRMVQGEVNQLDAFYRMAIADRLVDDLIHHRWTTFATAWNGPGQKANHYDTKLATAYNWFTKNHVVRLAEIPWAGRSRAEAPELFDQPWPENLAA